MSTLETFDFNETSMWQWRLPDTTFYMREYDPTRYKDPNPYNWVLKRTSDLFAGKTVVIVGLPGAFTPTCSNSQLPGFEERYDEFKANGVDEIWCTAVNDAFVMFQWAKHLGIEKVKMLPDGNGDFARELDMLVDKSNLGFGKRSWRYALIVKDMVIQQCLQEPNQRDLADDDPYVKSTPQAVIDALKEKEK